MNVSQVNETIEETLLEAERLVKKKKLQPPTEGQVAMASSSAAGAHMVFDLVSEDEDEVQEVKKTGQLCFFSFLLQFVFKVFTIGPQFVKLSWRPKGTLFKRTWLFIIFMSV